MAITLRQDCLPKEPSELLIHLLRRDFPLISWSGVRGLHMNTQNYFIVKQNLDSDWKWLSWAPQVEVFHIM